MAGQRNANNPSNRNLLPRAPKKIPGGLLQYCQYSLGISKLSKLRSICIRHSFISLRQSVRQYYCRKHGLHGTILRTPYCRKKSHLGYTTKHLLLDIPHHVCSFYKKLYTYLIIYTSHSVRRICDYSLILFLTSISSLTLSRVLHFSLLHF